MKEDYSNSNVKVNILTRRLPLLLVFLFSAVLQYGSGQEPDNPAEQFQEKYQQGRVMFLKGKELLRQRRLDEAITEFRHCITVFPRYADAHYYLAQIGYQQQDYTAAIQAIQTAEIHFAFLKKMEISMAQNEMEAAQVSNDKLQLYADYLYLHGNILFKLKQYEKAHRHYLEAIRQNPLHTNAYNNLINLHYMLENHSLAKEYLDQAEKAGISVLVPLKIEVLKANGQLENIKTWKIALKNGQVWTGEIVEQKGSIIVIHNDMGNLEFHRDGILSIEPILHEAAPAAEAPEEAEIENRSVPDTEKPAPPRARPPRLPRLSFKVSLSQFFPADTNYRELYGDSKPTAEIHLGYRIFGHLSLWIGYSSLSAQGVVPVVELEADSRQRLLLIELGYQRKIVKNLGIHLLAGLASIEYRETVANEELKDSTMGFRIGGDLVYHLDRSIYAGFQIGYLSASDTIGEKSLKLGGFNGGLVIGLQF